MAHDPCRGAGSVSDFAVALRKPEMQSRQVAWFPVSGFPFPLRGPVLGSCCKCIFTSEWVWVRYVDEAVPVFSRLPGDERAGGGRGACKSPQGTVHLRPRVPIPRKYALVLVAVSSLATLLLVEVAVRLATHSPLVLGGPDSDRYGVWDPVVGRLPRPGLVFRHPRGFTVSTGEYSTRSNGGTPPRAERPLALVVGDSFAFSDEVNDEDSWAAVLERLSGHRVINAGVPGFGLDQAVLRAEQLAEIYRPDIIIASFIPHDVLRCEMSYWSGHAKPYFEIDESGLRLHPAPVPSGSVADPLKWLLSMSVTMDLLFPKFLHWEGPEVMLAHRQGREVACRLMGRLAELGRTGNARVVVLAQPQQPTATPEQLELKSGVLACAAASHLLALDLFPVIESIPPDQRTPLFPRHMSVEGNRIVGTELARLLSSEGGTP